MCGAQYLTACGFHAPRRTNFCIFIVWGTDNHTQTVIANCRGQTEIKMRRPKTTASERQRYLRQLDNNIQLDKRRRRLYNRKFRRSFIFIATWAVRLIYFTLFILVLILNDKTGSFQNEIVQDKKVETYTNVSRRGTQKITTLYLKTDHDTYTSNIGDIRLPAFNIGDTLVIERNIFGKPIYFLKDEWGYKYGIDVNFALYYIVLFITFISLFFNDGLDRFTEKILLVVWTIDILAISFYFLT